MLLGISYNMKWTWWLKIQVHLICLLNEIQASLESGQWCKNLWTRGWPSSRRLTEKAKAWNQRLISLTWHHKWLSLTWHISLHYWTLNGLHMTSRLWQFRSKWTTSKLPQSKSTKIEAKMRSSWDSICSKSKIRNNLKSKKPLCL